MISLPSARQHGTVPPPFEICLREPEMGNACTDPETMPARRQPSVRRARKRLGWSAQPQQPAAAAFGHLRGVSIATCSGLFPARSPPGATEYIKPCTFSKSRVSGFPMVRLVRGTDPRQLGSQWRDNRDRPIGAGRAPTRPAERGPAGDPEHFTFLMESLLFPKGRPDSSWQAELGSASRRGSGRRMGATLIA